MKDEKNKQSTKIQHTSRFISDLAKKTVNTTG